MPNRSGFVCTLVVVSAVLVASCASGGGGESAGEAPSAGDTGSAVAGTQVPAGTTVALPEPVLESRACEREPAEGVTSTCHWLVVPENRQSFDGDTLRLAVTVLHSTSPDPRPDPVVYLSGGPGFPGGSPQSWSSVPMIAERDVIVYDQRGTGRSEPDLECPEVEAAVLAAFSAASSYEDESSAAGIAAAECHDRLVGRGVDLAAFSTQESAADLADLRVVLGYDEWNLLGVSYGSRLAQATMRAHPEGIRSVVLDSTYPLDKASALSTIEGIQRAFDELAAGCAADAACTAAHGDFAVALDQVIEQFDADPYRTTVDLGAEIGDIEVVITGADLVAGLFNAMYDSTLIPALPAFVSALANGEGAELIDEAIASGIPRILDMAEGMALSTNCADGSPIAAEVAAEDSELLDDPGRWSSVAAIFASDRCADWTHADIDAGFIEPVTSEIPTLVLSGTYDPITPTPGAREVAESLGAATIVIFDGLGHGVWNDTPCGTDVLLAFLADPSAQIDTSCADEVGPPGFL